MSPDDALPWDRIDTVFLDAGNTLVSIDFPWVVRELAERGVACDVEALRRAEAAARPAVSRKVAERGRTEGENSFVFYLRSILAALPAADALGDERRRALAEELMPVLRSGGSLRLWCLPMPRIHEGLRLLAELALRLVVVSNSDGTVAQTLERAGLHGHFEVIVDSHLVGFEKPDPGIFRHALEQSGADPERTLHVGDLYDADVVGARSAGVHPLLLDPYGDWHGVDCARSPDVHSLAERLRRARRGPGPSAGPREGPS